MTDPYIPPPPEPHHPDPVQPVMPVDPPHVDPPYVDPAMQQPIPPDYHPPDNHDPMAGYHPADQFADQQQYFDQQNLQMPEPPDVFTGPDQFHQPDMAMPEPPPLVSDFSMPEPPPHDFPEPPLLLAGDIPEAPPLVAPQDIPEPPPVAGASFNFAIPVTEPVDDTVGKPQDGQPAWPERFSGPETNDGTHPPRNDEVWFGDDQSPVPPMPEPPANQERYIELDEPERYIELDEPVAATPPPAPAPSGDPFSKMEPGSTTWIDGSHDDDRGYEGFAVPPNVQLVPDPNDAHRWLLQVEDPNPPDRGGDPHMGHEDARMITVAVIESQDGRAPAIGMMRDVDGRLTLVAELPPGATLAETTAPINDHLNVYAFTDRHAETPAAQTPPPAAPPPQQPDSPSPQPSPAPEPQPMPGPMPGPPTSPPPTPAPPQPGQQQSSPTRPGPSASPQPGQHQPPPQPVIPDLGGAKSKNEFGTDLHSPLAKEPPGTPPSAPPHQEPGPQRQATPPIQQSMTPDSVSLMSNDDMDKFIQALMRYLRTLKMGTPEHQAAQNNLRLLEVEVDSRGYYSPVLVREAITAASAELQAKFAAVEQFARSVFAEPALRNQGAIDIFKKRFGPLGVDQAKWISAAIKDAGQQAAGASTTDVNAAFATFGSATVKLTAATFGAQLLSVWLGYLRAADFALRQVPSYSTEALLVRVDAMRQLVSLSMTELSSLDPARVEAAIVAMPQLLKVLADEHDKLIADLEVAIKGLQRILLAQAAVELATALATLRFPRAPSGSGPIFSAGFVATGVTAGGVLVGGRLAVSVQWVEMIRRLVAAGVIVAPVAAAGVRSGVIMMAARSGPSGPATGPGGAQTAADVLTSGSTPLRPGKSGLGQYGIDKYGSYANRPKDKLAGHELLQNLWLEVKGFGRRLTTSASRENPAVALTHAEHAEIGRQQIKLGLVRRNMEGMTAAQNIELNVQAMKNAGIPGHVIETLKHEALRHAAALGAL